MTVTPADAASLILVREDGAVLLGVRAQALRFLGGFGAFAGGRVEAEDSVHARRLFGDDSDVNVHRAAALRELAEEMGLIICDAGARVPAAGLGFETTAPLSANRLEFVGRWMTPDYSPARFNTQFFLLRVQEGDAPTPGDNEMESAFWIQPCDALQQYLSQKLLLPPPTLWALKALTEAPEDAADLMRTHPSAGGKEQLLFDPMPGIQALALRTPTLLPATTTNTYILGHEQLLIVDPATYEDSEREKLLKSINQLKAQGATVRALVLTHHHPDHIGAASWLSEEIGAPIWAHALTKALVEPDIPIEATLQEGQVLDLGKDACGDDFKWQVLFTPGHAPGHIVLRDLRATGHCMIVGDMVAAIGSIIIDPPEGDMTEYLRQLRRLRALSESVLMPAHGPPIVQGRAKLDEYITHRLMRESKVFEALRTTGLAKPEDLLSLAYDDVPEQLYPFAARACLAHLLKLVQNGRVETRSDAYVVPAESPSDICTLSDGRVIRFAAPEASDAANLITYVQRISGESDFLTFGPGEVSITLEEEEAFIAGTQAAEFFALKATLDGEIVAFLNTRRSPRPRMSHTVEFGVSVRKDAWGFGIARAMLSRLTAWAQRGGLRKIELRVRADNLRARHLYESLGFAEEGCRVRAVQMGNAFFDEIYMGKLLDP